MTEKRDNYQLQMQQAKKRFLTYDQQELIRRCRLRHDENYFYIRLLEEPCRICRKNADMERLRDNNWVDANSFSLVMTVLDWLCDSRADRYITGRWVNLVERSFSFHRDLQEGKDRNAELFDSNREQFCHACEALGGERMVGGDIGYAIELVDGLRIYLQLWYGDEEFPPRLRVLWDENATRYIRYETTWYAVGLLLDRLKEKMNTT